MRTSATHQRSGVCPDSQHSLNSTVSISTIGGALGRSPLSPMPPLACAVPQLCACAVSLVLSVSSPGYFILLGCVAGGMFTVRAPTTRRTVHSTACAFCQPSFLACIMQPVDLARLVSGMPSHVLLPCAVPHRVVGHFVLVRLVLCFQAFRRACSISGVISGLALLSTRTPTPLPFCTQCIRRGHPTTALGRPRASH
jgi:hypothetical protein